MTLAESYRTAVDMLLRFRGEAGHVAAERAAACLEQGDTAGFDGWNRVCAMLVELNRVDRQTAH